MYMMHVNCLLTEATVCNKSGCNEYCTTAAVHFTAVFTVTSQFCFHWHRWHGYAATFLSGSLTAHWTVPGDVFQWSSCERELFMREGGEKGNSTRERERNRHAWLTLVPIRHWPLCSEALPREFSLPASRSNWMPFLLCRASLFPHRRGWGFIRQKQDTSLVLTSRRFRRFCIVMLFLLWLIL